MEHEHSPDAIRRRLAAGPRQSYLRDWVYGGIDGTVTTFAAISGVVGAQLPTRVLLIIGLANLLADGFSMAASNYLGTRSELEDLTRLDAIERSHIAQFPGGEREEVRQIFEAKGFAGDDLDRVVDVITSDEDIWVATMLQEEYGLPMAPRSAELAALTTFAAFAVCGIVPLLPFLLASSYEFEASAIMTGVVFFAIGAAKSVWSTAPWWRSGLMTLGIGAIAATLAYLVGTLLRSQFGA